MAECASCFKVKAGRPSTKGYPWYCSEECLQTALGAEPPTPPTPPTALYELACTLCGRNSPAPRAVFRLTRPQYQLMALGLEVKDGRLVKAERQCQYPHCGGTLMVEPLDTMRHHARLYTDPLQQALISGSGGAAR